MPCRERTPFLCVAVMVLVVVKFAHPGEPLLGILAFELLLLAVAAISLRSAIRIPRTGLRISPEGVTVRGLFRTRELRLGDVESFVPGVFSSGLARTAVGVRVKRKQGHSLIVWAMRSGTGSRQAEIRDAFARWQPVCDALDELLCTLLVGRPRSADRLQRRYGIVKDVRIADPGIHVTPGLKEHLTNSARAVPVATRNARRPRTCTLDSSEVAAHVWHRAQFPGRSVRACPMWLSI